MRDLQRQKSSIERTLGFSIPEFLRMPAAGLNMSDHSIKLIELIPKKQGFSVGRYINKFIPDGIITGGIVKEEKELISILSKIHQESGIEFIRVSVPEENAYSFNMLLPVFSEKELYNTIKFQLPEHVPLAPDEAVFDYDIVGYVEDKVDVSVSVLPLGVVNNYVRFFKEAGMKPMAFEIEAQTLARAVVPKDSTVVTMIVDIGRTRTGVAIVSGTVVHYTATLELGGDAFIQAIMKENNITFVEAEKLKQSKGIIISGNNQSYKAVVGSLSVLREELERRIEYWDTHISKKGSKDTHISKIVLCGGNATTPGLEEYIGVALKIPVEISNVWINVFPENSGYVPPIDFNHSLGFASAIGLALSNEI